MKLVFLLIDALKSNYLTEENMPYLYQLSRNGRYIKHIIPSPGFCERSEIFSGLDGYDTGCFTAIGYLPENSPYRRDSVLLGLFSLIGRNKISIKLFNVWRKHTKRHLNNYRIPYKSLKYFALTEDGLEKLICHEDIFTQLTLNGKSYTMDAFTSLADMHPRFLGSITMFIAENIKKGIDFIPYYIGAIDSAGHKYGSDTKSIKPFLSDIDNTIKTIHELTTKEGYALAILGDHGMVPVKQKVDIMSKVQELDVRIHKDYEAFYDSTSVRFWFFNDISRVRINELFIKEFSEYGTIITPANAKSFRIPLDVISKSGKPVYGDYLWCANPGILVSPDYFHSSIASEKGMHGYINVVEGDGTGLFVAVGEKVDISNTEKDSSTKICGELCDILGVNKPNLKWKRILR